MSNDDALPPELDLELGRMAAELDAEIRAEQAEYEAMAMQAAWRARRIVDVARAWMVHGDTVEVAVGGVTLVGTVIHTGTDLIVLQTDLRGRVDVAVAASPLLRLVRSADRGGVPPGPGPRTFVARLTEHEVAAASVVLVLDDGMQVDGTVMAVAADHVLLDSRQGQRVVPLSRVALAWLA